MAIRVGVAYFRDSDRPHTPGKTTSLCENDTMLKSCPSGELLEAFLHFDLVTRLIRRKNLIFYNYELGVFVARLTREKNKSKNKKSKQKWI